MAQLSKALVFPLLLVGYEISLYLSNDMYLPALPEMMGDLGLTSRTAQLTLTMWFLGNASMPLIIGAITDRFGRRPVLLVGGLIYVLVTIICAVTTNITLFLIARTLQGSMIPSMLIPGYACIHESYERKQAIYILALMSSISVLAPAFGPFLGSLVLYLTNWRTIFWLIGILAAVILLCLSKWMPETLTAEKQQSLHFQTLLKSYWRIVSNKEFMRRMFVLGFIFSGFIAWLTAGPLLLIDSFHYSPIMFGLVQALVFGAYIFGNRLVKYLLEQFTIAHLVWLGLLISVSGSVCGAIFSIYLSQSLLTFIVAMTIFSFGSALCFAPLNRAIIETSTEPMGVRMAIFAVCLGAFAVFGSGLASIFFNGTIASLALLIAAVIVLSCLLDFWDVIIKLLRLGRDNVRV